MSISGPYFPQKVQLSMIFFFLREKKRSSHVVSVVESLLAIFFMHSAHFKGYAMCHITSININQNVINSKLTHSVCPERQVVGS